MWYRRMTLISRRFASCFHYPGRMSGCAFVLGRTGTTYVEEVDLLEEFLFVVFELAYHGGPSGCGLGRVFGMLLDTG